MHLKRQKAPKKWPIPRKGTKYIVRAPNLKNGIPILVILRDILKIVQNRKELKSAMNMKNILVNNKPVFDEKRSVLLFDIVTIVPSGKYYRFELSKKGKFEIKEIKENEAMYKVSKITNKKILKGKRTQINLSDGGNFLSDKKYKVNDSVLINLKTWKVEENLPLKENAKVIIFDGKHGGETGVVEKIMQEKKIVELKIDGKPTNVLIKQLMVVGK